MTNQINEEKIPANLLYWSGPLSDEVLNSIKKELSAVNIDFSPHKRKSEPTACADMVFVQDVILNIDLSTIDSSAQTIIDNWITIATWNIIRGTVATIWKKIKGQKLFKFQGKRRTEHNMTFGFTIRLSDSKFITFKIDGDDESQVKRSMDRVYDIIKNKDNISEERHYCEFNQETEEWSMRSVHDVIRQDRYMSFVGKAPFREHLQKLLSNGYAKTALSSYLERALEATEFSCPESLYKYSSLSDEVSQNTLIEGNILLKNTLTFKGADVEQLDKFYKLKDEITALFPNKRLHQELNQLQAELLEIIQASCYYTSFTDDLTSEYQWKNMASNHTGFALEYNKTEVSNKCPLYPVLCKEKPHDTNYIINALIITIFMGITEGHSPEDYSELTNFLKQFRYTPEEFNIFRYPDGKDLVLASTITTDMSCKDEWRQVYVHNGTSKPNSTHKLEGVVPKAIYYGVNISLTDYNKLHKIAIERDIKEYKMRIDADTNTMVAVEVT